MLPTDLFRGASNFLVQSIRDNKPGTSYFCNKDMFSYLETNSQDSEIFNRAMGDLTNIHADEIGLFIKELEVKSVLDAGGGIGTLLCAILKHNPDIKGTIMDLPNVRGAALDYTQQLGFSNHISFLAGSFFEDFRAEADVITLHHVLHDYDNEGCIAILKNCKKSLSKDGSILVIETLLGKDAGIGVGWLKDLIMHAITPGGRVRSQEDFQSIFAASTLKIEQIYNLTSSDLSIIQLKPKDKFDF